MARRSRRRGLWLLLLSLLLMGPSLTAYFSSSAILHGLQYTQSGVWFMYDVGRYLGILAIIAGSALTFTAAKHPSVPRVYAVLMGATVAVSIAALWYAVHIFRSPWN